ncbi:hypothetical protein AHF37_11825 [Paragonimus kellicotti]|nr:hypothetical protein AHF37_11825 [Paragonimus kellicotti]
MPPQWRKPSFQQQKPRILLVMASKKNMQPGYHSDSGCNSDFKCVCFYCEGGTRFAGDRHGVLRLLFQVLECNQDIFRKRCLRWVQVTRG